MASSLTPQDKRRRANTPDSNIDEELIIPNMGDVNYMMMKRPRYPSRYYGYKAEPRSAATNASYGPSWGTATAAQRQKRVTDMYFGQGRYRKRRSYRGRGMYYGQGNYFSRMMHRQLNRTLAGKTPLGQLGKKVGRNLLGRVEGAVLGQGSYDLNGLTPASNNLVAGGGLSVPTFASTQDETGALTIQHSEYVKDIYGLPWSGGSQTEHFKNDAIHLNPAIGKNFPWLSQIAANYEEYEFKQLMFCFKTRVGDNLTTTDGQVGTIMMFTDYNATDKPRKTKQEMLQAYGTSVAKITDADVLHGIECDPSKIKGDAHKFIRVGKVDQDLHDFDWGLFQVAVDNTPETLSNKVIGELYVSYTVVLRKPRLFSTLGLNISNDQFLVKTIETNNSGTIEKVNGTVDGGLIATSDLNSIGAQLSLNAINTNLATYNLLLPASLSGGIEVVAIADSAILHTVTTQFRLEIGSGNITKTNDLARGGSNTSDADPSAEVGTAEQTTLSRGVTTLGHFNVEMASQDVDNVLHVKLYVQTVNANIDMLIMLRRYNTNEITAPPVFKTASGDVVVASTI
jgi:hypothetical protein